MSTEYQNSILWRGEDPTKIKFKPKYDGSKKATRYFPGQVPDWGKGGDEDDDDVAPALGRSGLPPTPSSAKASREARIADSRKTKKNTDERVVLSAGDAASSRLRRLQATESGDGSRAERIARHRDIHEARVLEELTEKAKDEEDELKKEELKGDSLGDLLGVAEVSFKDVDNEEEMMQFRREKARELALLKRQAEEDIMKKEEEDEEDIAEDDLGEEESEEESAEEDDPRRGALMKPVFVSRSQRDTIKEKETLAREEEEADQRAKEQAKDRKVETKQMVVTQIQRDDEAEQAGLNADEASDMELIDDDDEKNEAEEYEKWKIRELRRIKRDKEERLEREKEIECIERRRRMTDEEREADDAKLDGMSAKRADVKQFAFLQKYYHRGGFFQDKARTGEEPLYNRDYHEPTAEETFNKELLPKAMQLRRGQFGKKGQVKHTHLTESDTTDMTAAWSQHSKQVTRYQERMAGASGINNFDKPTHMKKGGRASASGGP